VKLTTRSSLLLTSKVCVVCTLLCPRNFRKSGFSRGQLYILSHESTACSFSAFWIWQELGDV